MAVQQIGENLFKIDVAVKVDGKQFRRLVRQWQGTERNAWLEYAKLQNDCKREAKKYKANIDNPYCTFGKLVEAFMETRNPSSHTCFTRLITDCGGYPVDAAQLKTKFLGGIDEKGRQIKGYVDLLDSEKCRKFHGYGMKGKVVDTDRLLSSGTKNKMFRAIKAVCQWAFEQDIIEYNPIKEKRHWKTVPRNRTMKNEEFLKLYNLMKQRNPEYIPIFLYSIRNPSRIGDLRKLTRENLNMFAWTISYVTGKQKVAVTQIVYEELRDYFKTIPTGCNYLFYREDKDIDGKTIYLPIGNFKKAWENLKEKAGITNLRWHDLRHHALTWLLDQEGIKTHHVMAIGGWRTRSMIEVYHNADHDQTIEQAIASLTKKAPPVKDLEKGEQRGEQQPVSV